MNQDPKTIADRFQRVRKLPLKSDAQNLEEEISLVEKAFGCSRHTIMSMPTIKRKSLFNFLQDILRKQNFG